MFDNEPGPNAVPRRDNGADGQITVTQANGQNMALTD